MIYLWYYFQPIHEPLKGNKTQTSCSVLYPLSQSQGLEKKVLNTCFVKKLTDKMDKLAKVSLGFLSQAPEPAAYFHA